MTTNNPLPLDTIIKGRVALRDVTTTQEEIEANGVGRKATPQEYVLYTSLDFTSITNATVNASSSTPIFICVLNECDRLFPSRERLAMHRKRDHNTDDAHKAVLTWNAEAEGPNQMQE